MPSMRLPLQDIRVRGGSRRVTFDVHPIPGFRGYFADTFGDVWSTRRGRPRRAKQHMSSDGYLKVHIYRARGRKVHVMVGQLVCRAFHGHPRTRLFACHRDGDRTHNAPANLYWGTRAENDADRKRHGRVPRGTRNGNASLTSGEVRRIRAARRGTLAHLARRFFVSPTTIWRIRSGRSWAHLICAKGENR